MLIFGFCPPSLPEIVIFFAKGNSLSQNLTVLTAPSGREPLAKPEGLRFGWKVFACRQRAKTLRWARGREGCSDSPLPTSGLHPPRNSNDDDRRQRRKQGGVVGAAASKTRVPPKARSGCWVPQPVSKGCTPLTILKKKSKHKKASAAPVGAIALTLFSLLHL